ncbi:MAG: DUF2793 domain-containing protein [Ahrensia sp.]
MENTPNLQLPYIMPAQAQKHVTHNEAIRMLDALVHLAVMDHTLPSPPVALDGQRWIVGANAQGAWAGHDGEIAAWQDDAWSFLAPQTGWLAWSVADNTLIAYRNQEWSAVVSASGSGGSGTPSEGGNDLAQFGVNTDADLNNRLAVKSNGVLLSHDESPMGSGDMRLFCNKATTDNVASQLYQNGFEARAETGLVGNDDYCVRVSTDGSVWHNALHVDAATGLVAMPATPSAASLLMNGDFAVNQRNFVGGALPAGAFGPDRWLAGSEGANVNLAGSGAVTLNSGAIAQRVHSAMLHTPFVTVSLDVLAGTGTLTVTLGDQTATIDAGLGRRAVTLASPLDEAGITSLTISQSGDPVTFARVKLEQGGIATPWAPVDPDIEFQRMCRYFFRRPLEGYSEICAARSHWNNDVRALLQLPVVMRVAPAVSWGGTTSTWTVSNGGNVANVTAISLWRSTPMDVTLNLATASMAANNAVSVRQNGPNPSWIDFNAEL